VLSAPWDIALSLPCDETTVQQSPEFQVRNAKYTACSEVTEKFKVIEN